MVEQTAVSLSRTKHDCHLQFGLLPEKQYLVLATIYSDRPGRHVLMGKCV